MTPCKTPPIKVRFQPGTTCYGLSGRKQKEQLEVWRRFHLARLLRDANELFKYLTVITKDVTGHVTLNHMEFAFLREL